MVVHQDSLDETLLNQIKSSFQTLISIKDKRFEKTKDDSLNFELRIYHRNRKTFKLSTSVSVNIFKIILINL